MGHNSRSFAPVSSVAEIYLGGTPSRTIPKYWGGEIKWASAKDVAASSERYIFGTSETITGLGLENSPAKLMDKDTVVITARGTVGAIRMLGAPMSFNQTCYGLVAKKSITPTFLFYALKAGIEDIKSLSYGTIFDTITMKTFDSLVIPIPSIPEQHAVAGILGALDDKIELNRRMNATLEATARAVFRERVKDVSEQGSILKFVDLLSGGTPSTTEEEYWKGNIEWVSAKDVSSVDGVFLLDTEKKIKQAGVDHSATKLLPAKTTVVTARGTVGAYCVLGKPMTMNQTNYGLKAKEGIGDYFVYFSLSDMVEQLKQQSYGTIFDTITTRTFEGASCAQPPIEVIRDFENMVSPFMDAILKNQEQSRTLASLRDALLPKLMKGEVRVKVG